MPSSPRRKLTLAITPRMVIGYIDAYCRFTEDETATPFQTVRGSFAEGEPIYPGSKILKKAHTQIAVRDEICILRSSLVEFA